MLLLVAHLIACSSGQDEVKTDAPGPTPPVVVQPPEPAPAPSGPTLPAALQGKVTVLTPSTDAEKALLTYAVQPEGQGRVSEGYLVRLNEDIPVYRMWSGPDKKDNNGNTNRMGGWWGYEAPAGTVDAYRADYEICTGWNDLTWMASCTLKKDTVVVVGPGQSVSAETCGDPTGQERYAANTTDWQIYVEKAYARPTELVCPDATADYEVDPADIAKRK